MTEYSQNPENWISREIIDNCLVYNEHVDGIDLFFDSEPIRFSRNIMMVIPESNKKKSVFLDYSEKKAIVREHSHKVEEKDGLPISDYPTRTRELSERKVDDFIHSMRIEMPALFGPHSPKQGLDSLQGLILRNGTASANIVDLILKT